MIVSKWGNSLAIRLPKQLVEKMNLKQGDEITLDAVNDKTLILRQNKLRRQAILRMAGRAWAVPENWVFDRDEANTR